MSIENRGRRRRRVSQATRLVQIAHRYCTEFFRNQYNEAFAAIRNDDYLKVIAVDSRDFKDWLGFEYFRETGNTPSTVSLYSALSVLRGEALHRGRRYILDVRVTGDENTIYYDLCSDDWRMVKITADGWEIIPHTMPIFRRFMHQQPQVTPRKDGDLRILLNYVPLKNESDEKLFLSSVATSVIPHIPHVIIIFSGVPGSRKTTVSKMIKRLVDPSALKVQSLPNDRRELAQQLAHHYLCAFDNISCLTEWQSDMLCRAATGEGFSKRKLYTDEDDVIFEYRRAIVLNGIGGFVQRLDLLDRCVVFELDSVDEAERKEERMVWSQFERDLPKIFGGLLNVISKAMKLLPDVREDLYSKGLPRMADFCVWGEAIARALGYAEFEFYNAYRKRLKSQSREVLTSDILAYVLLDWLESLKDDMGNVRWRGTASELYVALKNHAKNREIMLSGSGFPRAPNSLKRRLNEMRKSLAEFGVEILTDRAPTKKGEKIIHVVYKPQKTIDSYCSSDDSDGLTNVKSSEPSENTPSYNGVLRPSENATSHRTSDGSDGSDDILLYTFLMFSKIRRCLLRSGGEAHIERLSCELKLQKEQILKIVHEHPQHFVYRNGFVYTKERAKEIGLGGDVNE